MWIILFGNRTSSVILVKTFVSNLCESILTLNRVTLVMLLNLCMPAKVMWIFFDREIDEQCSAPKNLLLYWSHVTTHHRNPAILVNCLMSYSGFFLPIPLYQIFVPNPRSDHLNRNLGDSCPPQIDWTLDYLILEHSV